MLDTELINFIGYEYACRFNQFGWGGFLLAGNG